ncbi:hypothetical protein Tco_1132280 [Tanacetum coccineum]|uniref:Uncharacterized protein n=1 Tax=Tanacetum coccineum TaxID=301880 RepID=A0ABQ5JFK7_9ASTR
MERKINECEKSRNLSSEQTDRTEPPPPPQAQTAQVSVVFTGSGKFDDSPKIQEEPPPPIIVNNKIKKINLLRQQKGTIMWSKQNNIHSCASDLLILKLVLDNHYETAVRSRSRDIGSWYVSWKKTEEYMKKWNLNEEVNLNSKLPDTCLLFWP